MLPPSLSRTLTRSTPARAAATAGLAPKLMQDSAISGFPVRFRPPDDARTQPEVRAGKVSQAIA